jgi:microcystin-dependent protein
MEPFLAEIRAFSFGFAPQGWALANGAILPITQNQALFALVGNVFGGTSPTSFGLPDLRGRVAVDFGANYTMGQKAGVETVTLDSTTIPPHTHTIPATTSAANVESSSGAILAPTTTGHPLYGAVANQISLSPNLVSSTGGSAAHNNVQPFLALNYCIAMTGVWPPRS